MFIHVITENIVAGTFPDATGWHVDEHGYLHIMKEGSGNIATYRAGAWVSVERVTDVAVVAKSAEADQSAEAADKPPVK